MQRVHFSFCALQSGGTEVFGTRRRLSIPEILANWETDSDETQPPSPTHSDSSISRESPTPRVLASCSDTSSDSSVIINVCDLND